MNLVTNIPTTSKSDYKQQTHQCAQWAYWKYFNTVKCTTFPQQVIKTERTDGTLGFHHYLAIRRNYSCQLHAPASFYPQGTRSCLRLCGPQDYRMPTEGADHLKISKYPTGNLSRYLPSCGAVPQV
jgi:hypothetical protein